MGCDIHLYVEKRVGGKWVGADKWKQDDGRMVVPYQQRFYSGRNYNLFAILADVRNGSGFAGIKTGKGFIPISAPRGLPDNVSRFILADSEAWGTDGHSHSYFTLQELLDYDWTQVTTLYGVVTALEFFKWTRYAEQEGESPDSYCGGVSGAGIKNITREEMEKLTDSCKLSEPDYWKQLKLIENTLVDYYCQVKWMQPYYKCVGSFWSDTIPRLLRLGEPCDVRIVFWFDN